MALSRPRTSSAQRLVAWTVAVRVTMAANIALRQIAPSSPHLPCRTAATPLSPLCTVKHPYDVLTDMSFPFTAAFDCFNATGPPLQSGCCPELLAWEAAFVSAILLRRQCSIGRIHPLCHFVDPRRLLSPEAGDSSVRCSVRGHCVFARQ